MSSAINKEVGDAGSRLAADIKELVQNVSPFSTDGSIFKVPVYLRSVNPACYTPKLISLGPIHHGDEKLQPMEVYKVRYLHMLLQKVPDVYLEDLIKCLRGLEDRARNCYEDFSTFCFTSDQFLKLMLLDGCFIIMFLLLCGRRSARDENDPIFSTNSLKAKVYSDIRLLENQLPYFVLEHLFVGINVAESGRTRWTRFSFSEIVDLQFQNRVQRAQVTQLRSSGRQVKHFVDYMLRCNLPSHPNQTPTSQDRKKIFLPRAIELHQSGIKFSKGASNCFLDIKYTNGVMEIPTLYLVDSTEGFLRNLIAMEQHHRQGTHYITDYIVLMDYLINSPDDVAFLRSCGIIQNHLGSDEEAAQIFNNMNRELISDSDESHYYQVLEEVDAHCNKRWNWWKAKLRQDYFNNPWAIISFNAAVFLLICTFVQTLFSVLSATK